MKNHPTVNAISLVNKTVLPMLVLGTLALTACNRPPQGGPGAGGAPGIPKVMVTKPQLTTVTNWDEYPGHLEAVETVEIRPRVSGYLESIHFKDGAIVNAGDLLFVIDPKPYQAELYRAQADRRTSETRLALAQNDLKRAETLRGSRAISDEEFDSRSKAVQQAESALAGARASETMAQINLGYTHIKAPISGRIGRRAITPGNLVQLQGNSGAATILATIVSQNPIYCYFDANESSFLAYRKNGEAGGSNAIPCQLVLGGDKTCTANGVVDFFDNQVEPHSGTIKMRAVFPNDDTALVPGLFANVRVPAGPAHQVLLIPDTVISSDQGRKFVMVVGKNSTVEIRPVVTDRAIGTMRAIVSGLTAEDRVIVNGQMMLMPRPGVPVEVVPAAPGGTPAAPDAAAPKEEAKK